MAKALSHCYDSAAFDIQLLILCDVDEKRYLYEDTRQLWPSTSRGVLKLNRGIVM
jgi:hypothetical protein